MIKILINNEEVVCNNNISIKEEMLSTSSTILKNCYPKSWELDKDYVSRYYFPKDYSKCKITDDVYHPEVIGTRVSGTNFTINYDNTLNWNLEEIKGNTLQDGTPTPSSPVEIQCVTGLQNINVCGKNLFQLKEPNYIGQEAWGDYGGSHYVEDENGFKFDARFGSVAFLFNNLIIGEQYTISFNVISNININASVGVNVYRNSVDSNRNSKNYNSTTTMQRISFTFTAIGNNRIAFNSGNNANLSELKIYDIQLEQGSTATTYEPYKGNTYEVNLGKNLFDKTDSTQIVNNININGTTGKVQSATDNYSIIIPCKSNTTYTLSKISSKRFNVGSYPTYPVIGDILNNLQVGGTNSSVTITTGASDKYLMAWILLPTDTLTLQEILDTIQIEVGSQATSYSPYFTPIELNKIGTYQDRIYKENDTWYIEKNIGKVVLDGTENWSYSSNKKTYWLELSDIKVQNIQSNMMDIASNLTNYGTVLNNDSALSIEYGFFVNNQYIHIRNKNILNNINNFKTWLASNQVKVLIPLKETTTTEITDETLLSQLENIYNMSLLNGINNITITSENLPMIMQLYYNYKEAYTSEDLLFCGCVKNTGNISLNPRDPHYVDLQLLDFKCLLSEGETLNYVITGKTIAEAINQVVNSISDYGFVVGNIEILNPNDIINAYSTLNKTAYDVFQYIADITQSRWTTRMIDENTIAIDFYDPTLMPTANPIQSTQTYYENNQIIDISFNYSTNDYRNKQIMSSDEVFANITQTETLIADGYTQNFMCQNKLGTIETITVNGVLKTFATKSEQTLGITADFYYQPGEIQFSSANTISTGSVIIITYYAIVKGREIILNTDETSRIETQINRKGSISRYENRNDTTSSQELQKIGQTYIKYKGKAEINLKVKTRMDLFNVGQIVEYQAPLEELSTEYMVKSKEIDWYAAPDETFYIYELTSNFNYENAVNYFDNQRAKNQGNIGEGETITRNIDLDNEALILFYDTEISEIQVQNPTSLDFALDGVLI